MRYVAIWIVLMLAFLIGLGNVNWIGLHRLTIRGVSGDGVVTELTPENHDRVYYTYQVAGNTFDGRGQSWPPNRSSLSVGDSVVIWYDPEQPKISVLGNPRPMLRNETISILLVTLFCPALIVITLKWRLPKLKSRPQT
jgi:hypothetical protein